MTKQKTFWSGKYDILGRLWTNPWPSVCGGNCWEWRGRLLLCGKMVTFWQNLLPDLQGETGSLKLLFLFLLLYLYVDCLLWKVCVLCLCICYCMYPYSSETWLEKNWILPVCARSFDSGETILCVKPRKERRANVWCVYSDFFPTSHALPHVCGLLSIPIMFGRRQCCYSKPDTHQLMGKSWNCPSEPIVTYVSDFRAGDPTEALCSRWVSIVSLTVTFLLCLSFRQRPACVWRSVLLHACPFFLWTGADVDILHPRRHKTLQGSGLALCGRGAVMTESNHAISLCLPVWWWVTVCDDRKQNTAAGQWHGRKWKACLCEPNAQACQTHSPSWSCLRVTSIPCSPAMPPNYYPCQCVPRQPDLFGSYIIILQALWVEMGGGSELWYVCAYCVCGGLLPQWPQYEACGRKYSSYKQTLINVWKENIIINMWRRMSDIYYIIYMFNVA